MSHWKDSYCRTADQPYQIEPYVIRALFNLHQGLRVRWDPFQEGWAIEIKEGRAVEYIKTLAHYREKDGRVYENPSWVRARDGYGLIGHWPAQPRPSDFNIHLLRKHDIRRLGGAAAAELMAIRREEKEHEQWERRVKETCRSSSEESWENLVWREGSRVAVPSNYKENK